MTPAQLTLYWREWRAAAQAMKQLGHAGDDYQRRALQADAIGGVEKSSKDLTNAELTKVLAKFRSYSQPGNFSAQMHAEEEPEARHAATLAEIERLGAARGIKGGRAGVSRYFSKFLGGVPVEKATPDKLRRLLYVLKNRPGKAPASPAPAAPAPTATPSPAPVENTAGWDGEF